MQKEIHLYSPLGDDPNIVTDNSLAVALPGVGVYSFISNLREVLGYFAPDVMLEPAYPDWIINKNTERKFTDVITWSVTTQPAKLGGSPDPNRSVGTQEIKPRARATISSGDKAYELRGQLLDAFFYFVIWTQTAARAEMLADWFQNSFMAQYSSLTGSGHVYFYRREQDKELLKINNLLQTRTLIYYAQLAENYAIEKSKIREINLKLNSAGS